MNFLHNVSQEFMSFSVSGMGLEHVEGLYDSSRLVILQKEAL